MEQKQTVLNSALPAVLDDVCPKCQAFWSHWLSLRKTGESLPSLQSFLGSPNPEIQTNILIVDVISDAELRIRLFGTSLVALGGMELTGKNLLDFATPHMKEEMSNIAMMQVSLPCGSQNLKIGETASGYNIHLDILTLPVTPFEGGPPCLISCIDLVGELDKDDHVQQLWWYLKSQWIDLGTGAPPQYQHKKDK